jgi:hypothetical protein
MRLHPTRVSVLVVVWLWLRMAGSLLAQQLPDELSCASFPASLSEADLSRRFGEANVARAPVIGADDGPQDGTGVFGGTPRQLDIAWWDPVGRSRIAWVRSRGPDSRWRTPSGIAIGMVLRAIERLNGWPFRLGGLAGPEGLGRVRSWGRGRLPEGGDTGCSLRISLLPPDDRPIDPAMYRQVWRGSDFSSGHPAMQAINPRVSSLWVVHDPIRQQAIE